MLIELCWKLFHMRIQPVAIQPIFVKVAAFFSRRKFGKVITPLKTIYSYQPALLGIVIKMAAADRKLSLAPRYKQLVSTFVSGLNNCPFCHDLNLFLAKDLDDETKKLKTLLNFRAEPGYTAQEKALLAYCEEVTLTKSASDECYGELTRYFSDKEIVEITWLNAAENYFNLQAKPLRIPSDQLALPNK